MIDFPSYIKLYEQGIIDDRLEAILTRAAPCMLCPRQCMADRINGDTGYCQAPYDLLLSSASPHFGEEAPLVGTHGSGTIFLTHCNLRCCFCQNYEISIRGEGIRYTSAALSDLMMDLQNKGCHNINFVTPTHYIHQIIKALPLAIEKGLRVPLVYNTSGYDSPDTIRLLDGIFDIYMPDIKFMDPRFASRYCHAENYPTVVTEVIYEMHRQVGDLITDKSGIARKGLIIRHLQMPSLIDDSKAVLDFVTSMSRNSYVNIMSQYYPCHLAPEMPEISRRITADEHDEIIRYARSLGLVRANRH
ncbi:MAG: radical protein [Deltaproteobacteria bacterium]|nr:radical protein [Deltaproteobacteria bacterium]